MILTISCNRSLEDAQRFVGAFAAEGKFTVRFITQDRKHGEKFQAMTAEELSKKLPDLPRKSHEEQKHLFVRLHGSNIVLLDADDDVPPDGHAECLAMAPVAVVATSSLQSPNRQYWYVIEKTGLRGSEGRHVTKALQRLIGTDPGSTADFQLGRMPGSLNAKQQKLRTAELVSVSQTFFNDARFCSLTAKQMPTLSVDAVGNISVKERAAPSNCRASSITRDASSLDWRACCEFWERSPCSSIDECIAAVQWLKVSTWAAYKSTTATKAREKVLRSGTPLKSEEKGSKGSVVVSAEPSHVGTQASPGFIVPRSFARPSTTDAQQDPEVDRSRSRGEPSSELNLSQELSRIIDEKKEEAQEADKTFQKAQGTWICCSCGEAKQTSAYSLTQRNGKVKKCKDCVSGSKGGRPLKEKLCHLCGCGKIKSNFTSVQWRHSDDDKRLCKLHVSVANSKEAKEGAEKLPADKSPTEQFASKAEAFRFVSAANGSLPSTDARLNNAARALKGRPQLSSITLDVGQGWDADEKLSLLRLCHEEDLQHSGGANAILKNITEAIGGWTHLYLDAVYYVARCSKCARDRVRGGFSGEGSLGKLPGKLEALNVVGMDLKTMCGDEGVGRRWTLLLLVDFASSKIWTKDFDDKGDATLENVQAYVRIGCSV